MPADLDGTEKSITEIELSALQSATRFGVRLQPDEEIEDHSWRTVMRSVLIRRDRVKGIDCLCLRPIVTNQLLTS